MADQIAFTSTPDAVAGNPIDVIGVTTGAGSAVRERVAIGDGTADQSATVTGAGALKVDGSAVTQPVSGNVGITGTPTVDVGNFPASQAVTFAAGAAIELLDSGGTNKATISAGGALKVDGSAATQPVSGTVTANQGTAAAAAGSWPVEVTDGTNTLGVSAHPLRTDPTGTTTQPVSGTVSLTAATAVELLDGAGTNKASISAAGALKVDGSAVTQPISGSVSVSNFPATQPVSIAATVSENIASVSAVAVATAAAGVQKVGIVGSAGGVVDAAGQNAVSPANEVLVGAQFNTTPTGITSGNMSPLQCDTNGNLLVRQALTRTTIAITLDTTSVSTTEALQTVTIAKGVGVATTTGTSYTVTTGKTLRIQAAHVSIDASSTALTAVTVRMVATSAAIATTSPRFINMHLPAMGGGTVVSGGGITADISFPDGMEIPATDLIGVSAVATGTTAVICSVTLVGFEY